MVIKHMCLIFGITQEHNSQLLISVSLAVMGSSSYISSLIVSKLLSPTTCVLNLSTDLGSIVSSI